MFCRVIVDIAHENVAKPFTYAVPGRMTLARGQRVLVPFGRGEKEGVVLSLCEEAEIDPAKIREVIRPLEDYPAILPPLMDLAEDPGAEARRTIPQPWDDIMTDVVNKYEELIERKKVQ